MEETKVDELRIEAGSRAVKYEKKSRTRYINSSLQKLMFEDCKDGLEMGRREKTIL